ncbi:NAD(P)H-flavin reductase [Oleiphilus sp. HI0009]|uniref:NAD(P)H-flavin reductase n=1 Tax=unclassified Oleiphilus TaxID=2631174 RepID=UPI0007C29B0A|nr:MULTISPECIES: NAD(P)H-flavin reductase [unclassified Oleiphilus]KZX76651.1 NAD(P)H-flavin reductase [Oleiphilus sp. HI0009]MCH2158920.1 NAD(P)H-flavin reductase [Oleiphilaceae bacterium]KZX81150.1 NAD(P)H-flavin reductase [Oleiphilus sp. HI0009]KZY65323.1 NAD(P)H-flavin reductase [Oleiphilus sp. HI0066]KZY68457.1 NAD(P)H-flavin reductase [Oleiphilus sp. HI0067]
MNKVANKVTHECQVLSAEPLTKDTLEIELLSPVGTSLNYHAGQYLQLELDLNDDGEPQAFFYTIANRCDPNQARRIQLYIQNGSELAGRILKHLTKCLIDGASVSVTLPMGQAFLQTNLNQRHLLIASGSGIAKIKCLTEEALTRQPKALINIYWSNRHIDDFYLLNQFQGWAKQHKNLTFTPILETENSEWNGRSGYIYEVIEHDFEDLDNTKVYLCGSPQMVYGTIDKLESKGLNEANCYSDVFEYAPRERRIAI